MAETTLETLLKLAVEQGSAAQVRRILDDTRKRLSGIADAAKTVGVSNQRAAGELLASYKKVAEATRKAREEQEKLNKARAEQSRQAIGDVSTSFGAASSVVGGLGGGAAQEALGSVGDIAGLVEYLPQLQAALGALTAPMLALTGGLAALAGAVAFFNAQNDRAAQTVRTLIATQEEFYRVIKTGTREQLEAAIEAQQVEVEILRARADENKRLFAAFEQEVGGVGRAVADAFNLAGAKELREETTKLEGELRNAEFLLRRYEGALADNATAANDARAANEKLTEEIIKQAEAAQKAAQAMIDNTVNSTIQALVAAENMTAEQAEKRIAAANREIAIISEQIKQGGQSAENIQRLNERIAQLSTESATLSKELPKLRVRDALQESFKAVTEGMAESKRINDERAASLVKVEETLRDRTVDAARDRAKSLVDAQREADKGRAEAEQSRQRDLEELARDATAERIKIDEDYYKEVQRINRRFNRANTDAIAERDALAAFQAEQQRADELRDAREARTEGLQDLNRNLLEQRRLIQQRYNDQLIAVAERLNEQTRVIAERYNEQIRAAQDAAAKERAAIQQKYAQEIAVTQQGVQTVLQQHAAFWQSAGQLAQNALRAIGSAAAPSLPNNPLVNFGRRLLGFANGGTPPRNQPVIVGERGPEVVQFGSRARIFSNEQSRGMGGISISVNGSSKQQILRDVEQQLGKALTAAGWA